MTHPLGQAGGGGSVLCVDNNVRFADFWDLTSLGREQGRNEFHILEVIHTNPRAFSICMD